MKINFNIPKGNQVSLEAQEDILIADLKVLLH